jgi:hypothetical protein
MSFIRLNNILFEKSSVTFRKQHTYTSSSSGITGNLTIARRPSTRVRGDSKDFDINNSKPSEFFSEEDIINGNLGNMMVAEGSLIFDASNPYKGVRIDPGTQDLNGNPTSLVFKILEQYGDTSRSLRDTKYINVSASFGNNGSYLFSRPAEFENYNNTMSYRQTTWPGAVFFNPGTGKSVGYMPYRFVNESFDIDDVDYTPSSDTTFLNNEYFIDNLPQYANAIFDFRDEVTQEYVPSTGVMPNSGRNLVRNTITKKQITNCLMPKYVAKYNNCEFTYHNYHTLNFLHTDDYPENSCLVYTGSFFPAYNADQNNFTDFMFSFWINPRYTNNTPGGEFKAGTIMHVSSSIAVSLVSGSSTDENGYLDGYRIMLQLSQSAETLPSSINLSGVESKPFGNAGLNYPNNLIYLTPDNTLKKNHWHYVSVKWSPQFLNGSGSLRVDDTITYFPIPSASLGDGNSLSARDNTFIGNFFDGTSSEIPKFFSSEHARLDAAPINPSVSAHSVPSFNTIKNHPLNAEIHELRGFSKCLTNYREAIIKEKGLRNYDTDEVKFHVPVAFSRFVRGGNDYASLLPHLFNGSLNEYNNKRGTTFLSPLLTASIATLDTKTYFLTGDESVDELLGTNGLTNAEKVDLTTYFGMSTPFNINFSLGQGGKYLNLPNFVKNFAAQENQNLHTTPMSYYPMTEKGFESPRLFNLSASLQNVTHNPIAYSAPGPGFVNTLEYCYSSKNNGLKKRNLMILPNDNGLFTPNYFFLEKEETGQNRRSLRYKSELGNTDYGIISLRSFIYNVEEHLKNELMNSRKFKELKTKKRKELKEKIAELKHKFGDINTEGFIQSKALETLLNGATYKNQLEILKNAYHDALQRNFMISSLTEDKDSNDVSIFSISSLYYGEQIHPGTFEISDTQVTGSNSKISLKFKDDMYGSLYRADCKTPHASWASVGNVFYDEGICFIKSPHPPHFGNDSHELKFKGENTAQVLTINIPAPRDMINSSSSPSFLPVSASLFESDMGNDLVYITGVNIHDENLNVIMRANLAQPVVKRLTDEYMFKIKMDF